GPAARSVRAPSSPCSTWPSDDLRRLPALGPAPGTGGSADRTCVFPWCTRPARSCDLDHSTPGGTRRPDDDRQPRRPVPDPPPAQDPRPMALRPHRPRGVHLDQPTRAHLPARHHRHRPGRPTRPPTSGSRSMPPWSPPQAGCSM
ncbi:MAG: hypothetical protein AVDCRST_MAG06-529, partial [uncultured Nocardioides sp.]